MPPASLINRLFSVEQSDSKTKKGAACSAVMNNIISITTRKKVADETRTEFGYERTECACSACVNNCRHLPGYLIPDDLERINRYLGYKSIVKFAFDCLLASPGAIVARVDGSIFRIPTLVPRRKADGSCIFLNERGGCEIHAVSPFGCSFFDCRQSQREANERSSRGLQEIARSWADASCHIYMMVWRLLDVAGKRAIPSHVARQRMQMSDASPLTNDSTNDL